jgi:glucose dehydrogenase
VYAVDAADGHLLWTYDVTTAIGRGAKDGYVFRNRGVCYANGVIYGSAGSSLLALDAKTGKPIPGFGKNGHASVILDVLNMRYPDVTSPITLGILPAPNTITRAGSQPRRANAASRILLIPTVRSRHSVFSLELIASCNQIIGLGN